MVMELQTGFEGWRRPAFVMGTPTEAFGGGPLPQIFLLASWKSRGKMGITKIMK